VLEILETIVRRALGRGWLVNRWPPIERDGTRHDLDEGDEHHEWYRYREW